MDFKTCTHNQCEATAVGIVISSHKVVEGVRTIETKILWDTPVKDPRGYARAEPLCGVHMGELVTELGRIL